MFAALVRGSSPLTRGKRRRGGAIHWGLRIIPAHAGKTCLTTFAVVESSDHPRSRGENGMCSAHAWPIQGSSPLTRGKRPRLQPRPHPRGIIPAHAGKTRRPRVGSSARWDHPRSRGENDSGETMLAERWGSSPLTRGKPRPDPHHLENDGIIPAHAGKTHGTWNTGELTGDHPRSRGENFLAVCTCGWRDGSSPLTRGKRKFNGAGARDGGIIPAHAGKTGTHLQDRSLARDHPRSRGENQFFPHFVTHFPGSSPLTRGKLGQDPITQHKDGIIPAHAGKTPRNQPSCRRRRDHPRSRGENPI